MKKNNRFFAVLVFTLCLNFAVNAGELHNFLTNSVRQIPFEEILNQNYFIPQAVFVVNTTGDTNDALPGDGFCNDGGGFCSLRAAIQEANAFAGANIIDFDIPGGCFQTIFPASALPDITESVTINGYSQPGALPNAAATGSDATICIHLDGISAGGFPDGLRIGASGTNTTIKGLAILRFGSEGIEINGNGAVIEGNFIGSNNLNVAAFPNFNGISINAASARIGGSTLQSRNVVIGNTRYGIAITSPGGTATIQNNYIGLKRDSTPMGNGNSGILLFRSSGNIIGGNSANVRNVISANGTNISGGLDGSGIYMFGDTLLGQPQNNLVQGNYIGTNPAGNSAFPNQTHGVRIDGGLNNTIGGTLGTSGNLISGNISDGVHITGSGATGNIVRGNIIGLDSVRNNALGNGSDGVEIRQIGNNTIGGTGANEGNWIASNNNNGVNINGLGADNNLLQGNFIGFNLTDTARPQTNGVIINQGNNNTIGGTSASAKNVIAGNASTGISVAFGGNTTIQGNWVGIGVGGGAIANINGIYIQDSANNIIGGTATGAGNVISGNQIGLRLIFFTVPTTNNQIQGNLIGTDPFGTVAVANVLHGILLQGANSNIIGGTTAAARNLISGNSGDGISLQNSSQNNVVSGNYIGTKIDGLTNLPNGRGVKVDGAGSTGNVIGGTASGAGNVVSGNGQNGIQFQNFANNNRVEGNIVGLRADGSAVLPNSANGVSIFDKANNNIIGGTAAGASNIISGNAGVGVLMIDGAVNNRVEGNKIGTDATGTIDLGNFSYGVFLGYGGIPANATVSNTIGGTAAGTGNLISGNNSGGIWISGFNTSNNMIAGNYIGSTADGNGYLKNNNFGIRIDSPNNIVGGATVANRNLISGHILSNEIGVWVTNTGTGTLIQNNYIGTNAAGDNYLFNGSNIVISGSGFTIDSNLISGAFYGINIGNVTSGFITNNKLGTNAAATSLLGNGYAIRVIDSQNVLIGEDSGGSSTPNIIAGSTVKGIAVLGTTSQNVKIRQNQIYDNAGLGIDLGDDGVTQNDSGDPDITPNNFQNFPVINHITTTINGTLNSTPLRLYRLEFFNSPSGDPTGYGEGRTFITNTVVTTDASGNATFSVPHSIPLGGYISATATDLTTGDTSEFSGWKQVLAPTAVRFAGAKATKFNNGILLEWQTGFEADNLGFNIYRESNGRREIVNDSLIAGSALLTDAKLQSGFDYRWFDANASKDTVYYIEAVDLNSTKEMFGAFSVSQFSNGNWGNENSARLSELDKSKTDKTVFVERKAKSENKATEEQISTQNALTRFEGVRLAVKNAGYYRVSAAELFANGLPANSNPNGLRLFANGIEQPINVVLNENGMFEAIEFYGIGIDSAETDLRNYQLIASSEQGRRIEKVQSEGAPSNQTFYTATVERKDRTLYFSGLLNDQEENFFDSVINGSGTEAEITLTNLAQTGGSAEIFVKLQGLTRTSHNVQVEINGQFVGNIHFEAMLKGTLETQISAGILHEGANTVRLTSLGGATDLSLTEEIRLGFPRELKAIGNKIEISAQSGQEITVEGFTSESVRVFDITDANNVFELSSKIRRQENGQEAANSNEIFNVGFTPIGNGTRRILAMVSPSNLAEISANLASDLRTTQGGDLLIITKREMFRAMYPLMKTRQSQGLRSVLADVQDIYDEFNFSQKSTQAVKDFLKFAKANWQIKPRYVIFAGDSTYDPKRYLGGVSDVVPTRLVDTLTMETASDEWFGDFNGDNIAEFAIGRLPANNSGELSAMIAKIINYERQTLTNSATFVSDISDGFDFASANASVRDILPQGVNVQDIRRGEESDATIRSNILNAINSGQKLITYTGHGSTGIWRGNIFTKTDAENLQNTNLPIFVTMTCLNGYFQDPFNTGLAETLMKNPNGGAIAVWTSTSAGLPDSYGSLNLEIHRWLFNGATLGEAHLRAKQAISNQDVLQTFVLFGDPSIKMR